MDQIRQQIRRAKWRLFWGRLVQSVTWVTFAAMLVALTAIVVPKIWAIGVSSDFVWAGWWVGGAAVAGLLLGTIWAQVRERGELDAAIEIDLRYGLKERVSSALALTQEEVDSEAGQALLADAARRVERIDVREHFRTPVTWHPLLPVGIAVAAFLVAFLVHDATQDVAASTTQSREQIRKSMEKLKEQLEKRRKDVEAKGIKDADAVITKIQRAVDELSQEPDRNKVLVKLNNLAKELSKRKKGVEGSKKTREMLQQLNSAQRGPAERVSDALKKGDMERAMDELQKLGDKLRSDDLTDAEKKRLAEQLEQLQKEMNNMLGARQELENKKQDLQDRINQLKQEGKNAEAGELQQKLDQLQQQLESFDQQNPQMKQLQQLADKLGECADCMSQGDGQKAADQLDQIASDLQDLQSQLDSLETLNDMMSEIAGAKSGMNCPCGGKGCESCQGGSMPGNGTMGGMGNQFSENPGNGLGPGRGFGERPEKETDTGGYRARVQGNPQKGEAVRTGDAGGPNIAGQSLEEVKDEIASAFSEDAAPVSSEKLPRRESEHSREYFELLREGD